MKNFIARSMYIVLCMVLVGGALSAADNKKKKDAMPEVQISELTNQAWMAAVRMYADGTGLKIQQYGRGPFRLISLGNVKFKKPEEIVKVGETSLLWLEKWTGNQKMFLPRTKSEADAYCMVVVENDSLFIKILDFLRKKGAAGKPKNAQDDLDKAYKVTGSYRIRIIEAKKFNRIPKNWTANFVGGNALLTYYHERRADYPIWLVEGLKGELERMATGKVLIRTVSYEKNDNAGGGFSSWAQDMKKMIKKNDMELMKSSMVMEMDLIKMTHKQYVQMWSFGSFVRAALSSGRKSKNKYAQLIKRIAVGEDGARVLKDIFGKRGGSIKAITMAWFNWAQGQK